jgi:hypothetical protein
MLPPTAVLRVEDMTKALPRETFQSHVRGLGMVRIKRDT